MRRIRLAVVLAISLLVPVAAEAQPAGKFPRIGYLVLSPLADPPSSERAAFLDGLRGLGYVAGQNIIIEYRSAAWNRELLPDLVKELVDLKVDAIVAVPGTSLGGVRCDKDDPHHRALSHLSGGARARNQPGASGRKHYRTRLGSARIGRKTTEPPQGGHS